MASDLFNDCLALKRCPFFPGSEGAAGTDAFRFFEEVGQHGAEEMSRQQQAFVRGIDSVRE